MTCIVGLTAPGGRVFIGADSCGSGGDVWVHVPGPKVFPTKDKRFLVGVCGSFRVMDLLRFSLNVPAQADGVGVDEFMRTSFISSFRKLLLDEGHLYRENLRESGGNFMVAYRGRLFEVQNDFSVLDAPEWGLSVGSGEVAARGSLHTTRHEGDFRARLMKALEAAEAVNASVRGPFTILESPIEGGEDVPAA